MLRRILGVTVLAIALVGPGAASLPAHAEELPPGGTFVDDDGNPHEGYIEAVVAEDITNGCAPDHYCPADIVTRGQMAAFLRRALDLPDASRDHFIDDNDHPFEAAINAVAEAEITEGCDDPLAFCPEAQVTRGQMAAFLRRAGNLPDASSDYFTDDDGHLFEDAINAIAEDGVTEGCNPPDNTRFCPNVPTRRDQMASFLGRFLDLTPTPPPEEEPTTTADPAEMSADEAIREWFPDNYEEARRVAECESNMDPEAHNPAGYHGLFQIGDGHRDRFEQVTGQPWSEIYTAYYNAQYAKWLYDQYDSWQQWSCKP